MGKIKLGVLIAVILAILVISVSFVAASTVIPAAKKAKEKVPGTFEEKKPNISKILVKTRQNLCGDGICQEIVCMAVGCPSPETPETCPQDCK